MTARPRSVGPDQTAAFALELMLWGAVHHLPVVKEDELIGMLSDRDLLKVPDGLFGLNKTLVRDIMSTTVELAHPDDEVSEASARMAAGAFNCLPVVENGRLVGILTSTDILAERGGILIKGGRGSVPAAGTLMTRDVVRVTTDDDVFFAVTLMFEHGIRHLPVVDGNGCVVGMVSERNLRTALSAAALAVDTEEPLPNRALVTAVMTKPPIVVREETSIFDLARCFIHERIGALPVVDADTKIVGIVSYVDVLGYLIAPT